jgi:hypothetical protein
MLKLKCCVQVNWANAGLQQLVNRVLTPQELQELGGPALISGHVAGMAQAQPQDHSPATPDGFLTEQATEHARDGRHAPTTEQSNHQPGDPGPQQHTERLLARLVTRLILAGVLHPPCHQADTTTAAAVQQQGSHSNVDGCNASLQASKQPQMDISAAAVSRALAGDLDRLAQLAQGLRFARNKHGKPFVLPPRPALQGVQACAAETPQVSGACASWPSTGEDGFNGMSSELTAPSLISRVVTLDLGAAAVADALAACTTQASHDSCMRSYSPQQEKQHCLPPLQFNVTHTRGMIGGSMPLPCSSSNPACPQQPAVHVPG